MTTSRPFTVADGGADCHLHVFCGDRFPLSGDRLYQPQPCQMGTARDFRAVLDAHGLTHALLVGAGPYGTDNRCLLEAITASGGRFKGIALVDPEITEKDIARLTALGVVGCRINLFNHGLAPLMHPSAEMHLARLREAGWFVQIQCGDDQLAEAASILRKARVKLMIDHFGRPALARGLQQPGFQTLLQFGREGNTIIKLSGPFRSSAQGYPYLDVDPFIEAAVAAFTLEHCVWGSDWPFVRLDVRVDYGPTLNCLGRWLPDPKDRDKVLRENPARLFGFR
jgi:predicted TIM-barrel fold metal-dependent hydrolase